MKTTPIFLLLLLSIAHKALYCSHMAQAQREQFTPTALLGSAGNWIYRQITAASAEEQKKFHSIIVCNSIEARKKLAATLCEKTPLPNELIAIVMAYDAAPLTGKSGGAIKALTQLSHDRFACAAGNSLQIWDNAGDRCLQTVTEKEDIDDLVALNENQIASSAKGNVNVWDLTTNQCSKALATAKDFGYFRLAYSNNILTAAGLLGVILSWNTQSWAPMETLEYPPSIKEEGAFHLVKALAFTSKNQLASGSNLLDGNVRIWDVAQGKAITTLVAPPSGYWFNLPSKITDMSANQIFALIALPNEQLAAGCGDGKIRIWNVPTQECVHVLSGHTEIPTAFALVSQTILASGSADTTIRLWSIALGKCLRTLKGHTDDITALMVLPPQRLVSGSDDGTVRMWTVDVDDEKKESKELSA